MAHFACATRIVRQLNLVILGAVALCTPIWAAPPQIVYQNDFVGKWGSSGSGDGQFTQPFGIARNSEGDIFVVDISNSRVQKFDASGQFLSKFGTFGAGDGQFFSPAGIAINSSDEIYVVDFSASGNRVQQFDANGTFIRAFGTGGSGDGEFQNPRNLAIGPGGNVYVSDYGNDRIQIFEPDGDFIRAFGTTGSGNGELSFPDGIAVDTSGNVFVVDRANNRVQVFNSSDAFVRTWGSTGTGDGQFDGPSGLALGADGIVYVADFNNDRVQAFTTEGVFIGKWGTAGNGDGEFQGPNGVMVTGTGRVYVSNSDMGVGNRVQYFEPIWNVTMDEDGAPTPFSLTLQATDSDMDTITWSISGDATNGTAGATGTGTSKAITYTPDANYNGDDSFVVQIDDGNAGTATRTVNVTIDPIADAPVIDQGAGPLTVTMSQDGDPDPFVAPMVSATEPDGDTILWSVSSVASHGTATVSGSGATPPNFTYVPTTGYTGMDAFTIQASDGVLSDTIVVEVTINLPSQSPVIDQGAGPLAVSMDEDGVFTPPTLSATDVDTAAGSLTWSVLADASSGSAEVSGSGASPSTFTYTPATDFEGSDSFTVQVSDGVSSDTIVIDVTVNPVNDAPVIFQGAGPLSVTMSEDSTPTAFERPTLYATDVDGDSLTWSVASPASHGTATVSGTGSSATVLDYTPTADYAGSDSFTVQVSDGVASDTIVINVTIEPANDAPVIDQGAGRITAAMDEDGAFTAPALSATDIDTAAGSLTWSVESAASHGTATVSGSGATPPVFTYVPEADFNGSDSFTVQVSDGALSVSIVVEVTVNPVNDIPELSATGTTITMDEDGVSPDFSALAISATDLETAPGDLAWSVSAQGAKGTAGVSPKGASPLIVYVPALNQNGMDEFTLAVSDAEGGMAEITLTVTITPQPDAPIIAQGDSASGTFTRQGTASGFIAPALTASDPDDDTLTWTILTQATHGVAQVSGSGSSPTTLGYVAEDGYTGADSFVVAVSDEDGGTDSITINVTVAEQNDAPVIGEGAGPIVVSMNENGTFIAPGITASDGDNDTLTWSLGAVASHGEATVAGEGTSPTTLSYVPEANYIGSDRFTVTVSDGNGGSDRIDVVITIIEVFDLPVIDQGAGPITVVMDEDGSPTGFATPEVSASDSDSEASVLVWSLASPATHGTAAVSGTGASPESISYMPEENFNGVDSFTVSVADAEGGSDSIVVSVTVSPINDLPEIADAKTFNFADEWELSLPDGVSALTRLPIAIGPDGDVYTGGEAGIQVYSADGAFERNFSTFVADSLAVADDGIVFAAQTNPPVLRKFNATGEAVAGWPADANPFAGTHSLGTLSDVLSGLISNSIWSISTAPNGGAYFSISANLQGLDSGGDAVLWRQLDAAGTVVFTSNAGFWSDSAKYLNGRSVHTVDASHRIYVWEDTVQIYNADRGLIRQFVGPATGAQEQRRLAVSPDGESLFLAGENAIEVDLRDAKGFVLGKVGTGTVSGLAATDSRLYVSQHAGPRVRIYELSEATDLVVGSILEDQRFVYRSSATDADGQPLVWSVSEAPANGAAAVSTVSSSEVEVSFTPTANFFGEDSFSVAVSDGNGGTDTLRFEVTVEAVNDLPVIVQGAGPFNVIMDEDEDTVAFEAPEITAYDVEGSDIVWSVATNPTRGTAVVSGVGESPEVFTFTPYQDAAGVDQFTVRATDADGGVATVVIRVTVRGKSDPPRFSAHEEYRYAGRWDISLPTGATALTGLPIAVAPDGNVYTGGVNGIQIYDPEGAFIRSFSTFNADYLGVDAAGNVYGGVEFPAVVRKFTANGDVDTSWPSAQNLFGSGGQPRLYSLAVAPSGAVRLTWQGGSAVSLQNLDAAGAVTGSVVLPLTNVGSNVPGNIITGAGREITYSVATDDSGTAHVRQQFVRSTYTSRYRYDSRWEVVRRYDSAGTFIGEFDLYGMNQGARRTMAVRPDGERTFVSDSGRFFAEVHNRSGRVVSQFGGLGTGDGRFRAMSGMAANADGRIYVSDHRNRRIQYFDRIPDSELIVVFVNEDWDFYLPVEVVEPDGDPLNWTIDRAPEHGTATGGATLQYKAPVNFEGEDSLRVTVDDGNGNESSREIRIIINPLQDLPVIDQGDGPINVVTDKNKPFNQSAITATDPDSADVLTWTVISGPSNGVIQRTGTDLSSFAFTYTPARNYIGRDSIRLRVSDGQGGEDTIEIAITVRDVLDGGGIGGTPAANAARIQANFALVDANQDGKVSLAEVQSVYPEVTEAQFAELDLDQDGFLTEEELEGVEAPPTGCNNPGSEKAFSDTLIGRIIAMLSEGLLGLI